MSRERRLVCGAETQLPAHLITQTLLVHGPGATWSHVKRHLRCILERHAGAHQDCVVSATGDHAVWASWAEGQPASLLVRRLDCPHEDGCCLYAGHGGGHTPELHDPLMIHAPVDVDRLLGHTTAAIQIIR